MKLLNNFYNITESLIRKNEASFVVSFLLDNDIYKAHFPGMPVTPGVCIIQMAKELLEIVVNSSLDISSLKHVKFLSVISPSSKEFEVLLSKIVETDNGWSFQAVVKDDTTIYAKISGQVAIA